MLLIDGLFVNIHMQCIIFAVQLFSYRPEKVEWLAALHNDRHWCFSRFPRLEEQLAKTAEETKANFNAFERNDLKLREVGMFSMDTTF